MISLFEALASLLVVLLLFCLFWRNRRPSDGVTTGATGYKFSASTGIRREKTTYLEFAAPSPPNLERHSRPAILEIFDCSTTVRSRLVARDTSAPSTVRSADQAIANPADPSTRPSKPSHVYPPNYATKSQSNLNVFRIEAAPGEIHQSSSTVGDSATRTAPPVTRIIRSSSGLSDVDSPLIGPSRLDVDPLASSLPRLDVDPPPAGTSRQHVVARRPAGKAKTPRYNRQEKTYGDWAGSEGLEPIAAPPLFANESEICLGDVYRHSTPDDCQLWLRVLGENGPYWLPVPLGHEREDHRFLSVTQQKQEPSWITSYEWCLKCIRAVKRRPRE
ncbi:hypothetical protein K466DRAFT_605348 [Polyporus arcularius HHB13444]|uniref:Uncharacterized protein n=1 Tax=Polyporus arcularius HHB13444 TaxID=1314778 RepID=A0A5C3NSV3_9APHY|nr:hypothetical protein K466DRAFT_605348 [Polyporus arcularius HHB13444]